MYVFTLFSAAAFIVRDISGFWCEPHTKIHRRVKMLLPDTSGHGRNGKLGGFFWISTNIWNILYVDLLYYISEYSIQKPRINW